MKASKRKFDLYQAITDQMIALLEAGTAPWRCPWSKYGSAKNYATDRQYTGINRVLLNMAPHPVPFYMTWNQLKERGGNVRKGAKSHMVVYWNGTYKVDGYKVDEQTWKAFQRSNGEHDLVFIPFIRYYRVFNIEDIEGVDFEIPEVELHDHEKIDRCEAVIRGMPNPPKIEHKNGNRAFYRKSTDTINMPELAQFVQPEAYYGVLFHELTHATGHPSRLHRDSLTASVPFGHPTYSKEELIAEMGTAFLCGLTGIDLPEIVENQAAYLAGWLQVLKGDKKLIFQAAAAAEKAVGYIIHQPH